MKTVKRVVLVRHGQNTWDAKVRVQDSSNFSILTKKGEAQAEASRQMLIHDLFDICFSFQEMESSGCKTCDQMSLAEALKTLGPLHIRKLENMMKLLGTPLRQSISTQHIAWHTIVWDLRTIHKETTVNAINKGFRKALELDPDNSA